MLVTVPRVFPRTVDFKLLTNKQSRWRNLQRLFVDLVGSRVTNLISKGVIVIHFHATRPRICQSYLYLYCTCIAIDWLRIEKTALDCHRVDGRRLKVDGNSSINSIPCIRPNESNIAFDRSIVRSFVVAERLLKCCSATWRIALCQYLLHSHSTTASIG